MILAKVEGSSGTYPRGLPGSDGGWVLGIFLNFWHFAQNRSVYNFVLLYVSDDDEGVML